jgi:5'-deoxynucleotidase
MKTDKELDNILHFMLRADKLKEIERTGWLIAKIQHPEHDGDHSYSTAAMSYLIAKRMRLDAERCAVIGIFHDIGEVITGDIATRYDKSLQTVPPLIKMKLGRQSELKLAAILNKREKNALRAVLDEYHTQRTKEAKLVKQVDKLDYIVQIMLYHKRIKSDERVEEFFKTANSRIDIPEVRYIFEKIKEKVYRERGMRLPGASAFQKKRYQ